MTGGCCNQIAPLAHLTFVSFHLVQEPAFPLTALTFGACTLWAVSFPKDPQSQREAEGCVCSVVGAQAGQVVPGGRETKQQKASHDLCAS